MPYLLSVLCWLVRAILFREAESRADACDDYSYSLSPASLAFISKCFRFAAELHL